MNVVVAPPPPNLIPLPTRALDVDAVDEHGTFVVENPIRGIGQQDEDVTGFQPCGRGLVGRGQYGCAAYDMHELHHWLAGRDYSPGCAGLQAGELRVSNAGGREDF